MFGSVSERRHQSGDDTIIDIVVIIQNNGFCVYKVQWKSDRDFSR